MNARTQRVSVEVVFSNKSGSDAHPIFAAVRAIEPVPPAIAVRRYTATVDTTQIAAEPIKPPMRTENKSTSGVTSNGNWSAYGTALATATTPVNSKMIAAPASDGDR